MQVSDQTLHRPSVQMGEFHVLAYFSIAYYGMIHIGFIYIVQNNAVLKWKKKL